MADPKEAAVSGSNSSRFTLPSSTARNELEINSTSPRSVENFEKIAQIYVDPSAIESQRFAARAAVDSEAQLAKQAALRDYESQKASIALRLDHEIAKTEAAIEQSRQHALFALEGQHQQRRMEVEQKSQEQRLQIEATANEMIMQAREQRLHMELEAKYGKILTNPSPRVTS
jgi:predicted neuraminidase